MVHTQGYANCQYTGQFDDITLWNHTLGPDEVIYLHTNHANLTGLEPGLVLLYDLDEEHGSTAANRGSAGGAKYDLKLGAVANGDDSSTSLFATGDSATRPLWANANTSSTSSNSAPIVFNGSYTAVEDLQFQFWPYGYDADGDFLVFIITSLPSHGTLFLLDYDEAGPITSTGTQNISSVPFEIPRSGGWCLWWIPQLSSEEPVTVAIQASDGHAMSDVAVIDISLLAIDSMPSVTAASYTANEDGALDIELEGVDPDSDFLTIVMSQIPLHGKLFLVNADGSTGNEVSAFSEAEVISSIIQYVSNVHAVSSFWPAGDDAGNGFPSWHPFQIVGEQSVSVRVAVSFAHCLSSCRQDHHPPPAICRSPATRSLLSALEIRRGMLMSSRQGATNSFSTRTTHGARFCPLVIRSLLRLISLNLFF